MAVCSNKHENDEPCYTTASRSGTAGWEGRAVRDCRAEAGTPGQDREPEEGACTAGPACTEEAGRAGRGCRAAVEEACWARARGCRAKEEGACTAGPGCTAREQAQEGRGGWGHKEEGCGGSAVRRDGWGHKAQEKARARAREGKDDWGRTAQEKAREGRDGWGHKAREQGQGQEQEQEQGQGREGRGGWGHREEEEGCGGRREGAAACRAGSSRRARGSTGARAT